MRSVKRTLELGFGYLPGSIRVRIEGRPARVEELEPAAGTFQVEAPEGFDGDVSVDYRRTVHRGGTARPDRVIGVSDACIYCGSRSDLRDEHIIPYGLEGELVLRRATCVGVDPRERSPQRVGAQRLEGALGRAPSLRRCIHAGPAVVSLRDGT